MPFAYYRSLSRRDRSIYDASDRVPAIALPRADALHPIVEILRQALERDDRALVEAASSRLVLGITELLEIEPVSVGVLAVRPELLHEVCHHLDYTLLGLAESFHTQGFFSRESSLFKQLVPESVLARERDRERPRSRR